MQRRRTFLTVAAAWAAPATPAWAARPAAGTTAPLLCGADVALAASGLARDLQLGFGRDTGIRVTIVVAPALALLEAARLGDIDVLLCNTPDAESALEAQGLLHDRRPLAVGGFAIVAPAASRRRGAPATLPRGMGAVDALARLGSLAGHDPAGVRFLSANDGSGVHVMEQGLWRQAKVAPAAPWYLLADPARDFIQQVRQASAWALVERAAWQVRGGGAMALAGPGDPLLDESVHVMRSFHDAHPAGRMFTAWVGGPHGRAVARAHRGYRDVAR